MIQIEPVMTRKTISMPKASARILLVLSGPLPRLQEEHEVDTDLREGEHNQSDRDARGPQQVGLRHDERGDRREDREPQSHRIRQVAGRGLMLLDARRAVVEYVLVSVRQW